MKWRPASWYLPALLILMALSLFALASCTGSSGGSQASTFYNAGAADISVTGAQFAQYSLYRFDTTDSAHILALPSAADIVANLSSPAAGEVLPFAVTADGSHTVTLIGGTNVTVKPSASTVAGNTTLTIYCELDNVTAGSEAVTIY